MVSASVKVAALMCRIVLVPGAFAEDGGSGLFLSETEYFSEYRAHFEGLGCRVRQLRFPPDGTIEERARLLRNSVEELGGPVALVAHSQGALDARYALAGLGLKQVTHLVSIGAPHQGTPLADWVLEVRKERGWVYWLLRALGGYDLAELRFAAELSPGFLRAHRDKMRAVPGVRYASGRGVCLTRCSWALRLAAWLGDVGRGDGLVPEASQSFGTDLGEYDLDHLSQVGVDRDKARERRRFLERVTEFLGLPLAAR